MENRASVTCNRQNRSTLLHPCRHTIQISDVWEVAIVQFFTPNRVPEGRYKQNNWILLWSSLWTSAPPPPPQKNWGESSLWTSTPSPQKNRGERGRKGADVHRLVERASLHSWLTTTNRNGSRREAHSLMLLLAYMRWWYASTWSRDFLICRKYSPAAPFVYGPTWHCAYHKGHAKLGLDRAELRLFYKLKISFSSTGNPNVFLVQNTKYEIQQI